jgi:hypothetical protein
MADMTNEQAARVLEKFQNSDYGRGGKVGVAIDTAIAVLREQGWVKTAERLPTVLDADDEGKVPVLIIGMLTGRWIRISVYYKSVTMDTAEYFLPLPGAPEVEG